MSNVLTEEKQQQAIALGRLGWSLRQIERAISVRRETIGNYLKAAGIVLRPARGRRLPSKPASEVTTDRTANDATQIPSPATANGPAAATRSQSPSACEPYRELIQAGLARGRNAMGIWQDLVDQASFGSDYQSVKRFVRKLRGTPAREACAIIATAPGEECQVDYGNGPMVREPNSGKYRRTRLLVLTLGYSRKSVRLLGLHSSSRIWAELHERAFGRLGGVTRVVVLDNLGEGVLKPDIWDPTLNPLYREMLAHYGAVAMPCRVRDPDRKGKVESGVGHAQKTPLKGQRFESLQEAQDYLDHWEQNWADTRIHGTTKRQVATMFAEERPSLLPLPVEPFRYYQYGERTVHLDGCVEVEAAYYGAPPGWLGRQVRVQWDGKQVRLLDPRTGHLLREHLRQERGRHRIQDQDRPKHTPPGTLQLLARTQKAGPHIGTLCQSLHQQEGQLAIRRIQGVLALAKQYGPARVEEACGVALEMGVSVKAYRFLRRWLEHSPQLPLSLRQVDPLIRQLNTYRDLIEERTNIVESTDKEIPDEHD